MDEPGLNLPGGASAGSGAPLHSIQSECEAGGTAICAPVAPPKLKKPSGASRKSKARQEAEERSRKLHASCSGEYHTHDETTHLEKELRSVERRAESLRRSVKESRRPPPRQESKEKTTISVYLSRASEFETKLRTAEVELQDLQGRLASIEKVHKKEMQDFISRMKAEHEAKTKALQEKYDLAEAERIRFSEKVDELEPALKKSNAVCEMLAKQLALGGDAEELRERLMRLEGQKQDALTDRTLSLEEIAEAFGLDAKCPCVLSRGVELEDIITHLNPEQIAELGPYEETGRGLIRTVWGPQAAPFLEVWKKHERSWCSLECSPDYRAVRLIVPSGIDKLPEKPVTYINREAVPPGVTKALTHGDVISFSCSPTEFSLVMPYHAEANPNFHRIWDAYGCDRFPVVATTSGGTLEDVGFQEAWDALPHAEMEPSESEREKHFVVCRSHFKQMLATEGEDATREAIEQWKTAANFWRLYFISGSQEWGSRQ